MGRRLDFLPGLAVVGIAAALTIIVIGRALDSGPAHALDATPAGPVLAGIRGLWSQVYDSPA